jgi:hypothetical protein
MDSFRLPSLIYGVIKTAQVINELYNTSQGINEPELYNNLLETYNFIGYAHSRYVKEFDDKLLEKQPMWKDALNLVKKLGNKARELLPTPQPAPIKANYSLEDKI